MIVELNDENYSEFIQNCDKAVFIDFYSPSCGPCQELMTQLPHIDAYFKDEAIISKVNVSMNPKLAQKYEISSVPFCVSISPKDKMLKDFEVGQASVDRYIRMIQKAQGKGFFSRLFG